MPGKISPRLAGIIRALPLRRGMRVLEIGCGPGVAARAVLEKIGEGHVLATDRSATAIAQAVAGSVVEMASGRLEFRCVAVEDFQLMQGEEPYDLAFAVRVGALDGRHPEPGRLALARLKKALVKGGKLFIEIPEIKRFNKGVLELLPGDTVHLEFEEKGDDLVNPKVVAEVQHPNRTITFKMTQDESMTMLFRESAIEKAVAFDCTHRGLRSEEFATTYLNPTEKGLAAGDSWPNSVWILRLSNIEASSKPASEIYREKVSKGKEKQEKPATDEAEPAQEEQ